MAIAYINDEVVVKEAQRRLQAHLPIIWKGNQYNPMHAWTVLIGASGMGASIAAWIGEIKGILAPPPRKRNPRPPRKPPWASPRRPPAIRLPWYAAAACHSGSQSGRTRLCAVWTCRSGWGRIAPHGFPERRPRRGRLRGGGLRQALTARGVPLFGVDIPRLKAFEKAAAQGVPVCEVDDPRAKRAWEAYSAAGKELFTHA